MADASEITELLNAANSGNAAAQETVFGLIYDELKRCAQRQRRSAPGSSMTPTALVHELFLRLNQRHVGQIESRAHFFALAARAMRQIIVDHARRQQSVKRGGGIEITDIENAQELGVQSAEEALDLDAALTDLAARDPYLARVVEWHFFGGLSFKEIGTELGRQERAVHHDWEFARALLQESMLGQRSA
jgi:RNA polymerase sigma factor (TIGR02999 family)